MKNTSTFVNHYSKTVLLILITALFQLTSCNNTENSEEKEVKDTIEVKNNMPADETQKTIIEGDISPLMDGFTDVEMSDDGKSVKQILSSTLTIVEDKPYYKELWNYDVEENENIIYEITEKKPGEQYEVISDVNGKRYKSWITKTDIEGIWKFTNAQNDHIGYMCEPNSTYLYESPAQIIQSMGEDWIALSKHDGDWVIYNECHYGSGGIHFDKDGKWIEYSGGGDAWSYNIIEMKNIDMYTIKMVLQSEMSENIKNIIISKTQDDLIYFNKDSVNEERYVLSGSDFARSIRTIDEECDD